MAERLHHAVVNESRRVSGVFPDGELGLGEANEFLASLGGIGTVIFVRHGSQYTDAQKGNVVHGLEPKGDIQADNIIHESERLRR